MSDDTKIDSREIDEHALADRPKVRRCLRCDNAFESAWSGERICARCKGSNAWRLGQPHSYPAQKRH